MKDINGKRIKLKKMFDYLEGFDFQLIRFHKKSERGYWQSYIYNIRGMGKDKTFSGKDLEDAVRKAYDYALNIDKEIEEV